MSISRLQLEITTMKKSLQLQVTDQPEDSGSYSDDDIDQVPEKSIVIPNKLITVADSFKNEHSWY